MTANWQPAAPQTDSFVDTLRRRMPLWARRFDPRLVLAAAGVLVLLFCCCCGLTLAGLGKKGSDHGSHHGNSHPTSAHTTASSSATASASEKPNDTQNAAKLTVPNVVGKNAAVAGDELKRAGFTRVRFSPADSHHVVILPQDWTVKNQSAAPGSTLAADAALVLGCVKNS